MYLLYVDESGDPGYYPSSPTRYFYLSGIAIHESKWRDFIDSFTAFRRELRIKYSLKLREEIHASDFISKPGELRRIPKYRRLQIMSNVLNWLSNRDDVRITTIVVDKEGKEEGSVFEIAWSNLIQRFEHTIAGQQFPLANPVETGMIIPDNINGPHLSVLLRSMREHNPCPTSEEHEPDKATCTLNCVVEDPFMKDSMESYMHQIADVVAYFAKQKFEPNSYFKKRAGKNYYDVLKPVLNTYLAEDHPLGMTIL